MAYEDFTGSLPGEQWRGTGIRGYEVSNLGRVRSSRGRNLRLKKAGPDKDGYLRVSLGSRGQPERGNYSIHKLVLEAWRGACPDGWEADHKDGDRANNHLSNLRWLHRDKNMSLRNVAVGKRNPTASGHTGGVQCECSTSKGPQCSARAYRMVVFKDGGSKWMCGPHLGSAKIRHYTDIESILTPEDVDKIDNPIGT